MKKAQSTKSKVQSIKQKVARYPNGDLIVSRASQREQSTDKTDGENAKPSENKKK